MNEFANDRNPVEVLADQFADRMRLGESPSIDDYADEHPDLADEIRDLFPSIQMMEKLSRHEHEDRSGTGRDPYADVTMPKTLGDFDILREIGRGGMGIVYEAMQKSLKRRVALKVLGPGVADSPKQLRRFQREAEAAARLHHSNIVPVYGISEDQGLHFFAMQYIDGVPLSEAIRSLETPASVTRVISSSSTQEAEPTEISHAPRRFTPDRAAFSLLSGRLRTRPSSSQLDKNVSTSRTHIDSDSSSMPNESPQRVHVLNEDASSPHVVVTSDDDDFEVETGDSTSVASSAVHTSMDRTYWQTVARIVADIADAMSYAHRHGVLHRDVKPSNILLDETGVVWVTDFGLAKHEDHDGVTNTGDIVGTLRYMAPEQFSGDTDSRSDIYSLGLTLYELLTLTPAYTEVRHGPLIQQKTTTPPPPPRSINSSIPRDLETICLKACASDPHDRYQTAGALADDLQRFFDDLPIQARRISATERLWRWTRRNPMVAGLSGLTITLLVAVAVVSSIGRYQTGQALAQVESEKTRAVDLAAEADTERNRAESEQARAESERTRAEGNLQRAVRAFEQIIDNISSRGLPQSTEVEIEGEPALPEEETVLTEADAELLETLLVFFDEFAEQNTADLKPDVAEANRRVGDIHDRLRRPDRAKIAYEKAISIYETLLEAKTGDTTLSVALARVLNELASSSFRAGRMSDGGRAHRRALTLLEETTGVQESSEGRFELAKTLNRNTFSAFSPRRRPPRRREEGPDSSSSPPTQVAATDGNKTGEGTGNTESEEQPTESRNVRRRPVPAEMRADFERRVADAMKSSTSAISLLDVLLEEAPSSTEYRIAQARCYRNRANLVQFTEGPEAATDTLSKAIQILDGLVTDFPGVLDYRYQLADTLCMRIRRRELGDSDKEYEIRVQRALTLCDKLTSDRPGYPEYLALSANALNRLASIHRRNGLQADADNLADEALRHLRSIAGRYPNVVTWQYALVQSLIGRAGVSEKAGDLTDAHAQLDEAISVITENAKRTDTVDRVDGFISSLRKRQAALGSAATTAAPATTVEQ